jgi:ankyrin repeat protein
MPFGANFANEDILKWHLEHGADPNILGRRGYMPLEYAAYHYPFSTMKLLVDHGADVRNKAALHSAAANSIKFGKVHPGRLEVTAFLLDRGANIDLIEPEFDPEGNPRQVPYWTVTALHRAVQSEDLEHIRFLLRRGANRHIKGVQGNTLLELAENRHMHEIVDILRNEWARRGIL